jgi:hypothetical protein
MSSQLGETLVEKASRDRLRLSPGPAEAIESSESAVSQVRDFPSCVGHETDLG